MCLESWVIPGEGGYRTGDARMGAKNIRPSGAGRIKGGQGFSLG